jgi:hypothetical protein
VAIYLSKWYQVLSTIVNHLTEQRASQFIRCSALFGLLDHLIPGPPKKAFEKVRRENIITDPQPVS